MMATAPTPGRAQADAAAQTILRITIDGKVLEFQPAALTLTERFVIRHSTTLPFEAFFSGDEITIGEDSVAVLVWVARRQNGEPNLAFRDFANDWHLDPDTFDLEVVEPDDEDDHPEG